MNGRRNVTRDIWRAVVVAGAMLAPACSSSPKQASGPAAAEPVPTEAAGEPGTEGDLAPTDTTAAEPPGEGTAGAAAVVEPPPPPPDAGTPDAAPRPRKGSDRPRGRGFVLA